MLFCVDNTWHLTNISSSSFKYLQLRVPSAEVGIDDHDMDLNRDAPLHPVLTKPLAVAQHKLYDGRGDRVKPAVLGDVVITLQDHNPHLDISCMGSNSALGIYDESCFQTASDADERTPDDNRPAKSYEPTRASSSAVPKREGDNTNSVRRRGNHRNVSNQKFPLLVENTKCQMKSDHESKGIHWLLGGPSSP